MVLTHELLAAWWTKRKNNLLWVTQIDPLHIIQSVISLLAFRNNIIQSSFNDNFLLKARLTWVLKKVCHFLWIWWNPAIFSTLIYTVVIYKKDHFLTEWHPIGWRRFPFGGINWRVFLCNSVQPDGDKMADRTCPQRPLQRHANSGPFT